MVLSVICIIGGGGKKRRGFEALPTEDEDEQSNLINEQEPSVSYDATKNSPNSSRPGSLVDNTKHTIQ